MAFVHDKQFGRSRQRTVWRCRCGVNHTIAVACWWKISSVAEPRCCCVATLQAYHCSLSSLTPNFLFAHNAFDIVGITQRQTAKIQECRPFTTIQTLSSSFLQSFQKNVSKFTTHLKHTMENSTALKYSRLRRSNTNPPSAFLNSKWGRDEAAGRHPSRSLPQHDVLVSRASRLVMAKKLPKPTAPLPLSAERTAPTAPTAPTVRMETRPKVLMQYRLPAAAELVAYAHRQLPALPR